MIRYIGPNTTINWLYYNEIDKMVHLDFSSNFVSDLNTGSSYEALCLSSITNTIGYYYNCNKVYITLNGKPYSSGHIEKKIGEPFLIQSLIGPFGLKEWKIYNCVYPITYVVKTGDTLSNIVKDYCTTYQNLANLNNIEIVFNSISIVFFLLFILYQLLLKSLIAYYIYKNYFLINIHHLSISSNPNL